jgi:hypothetical protein
MLYQERHPFDLKKKREGFKKQKTQQRLGFLSK